MTWLEALILGIVQGLTEYLPVSSSGHIEIVGVLLGRNALPADNLWFTVILHFATALSTIVVFRKRILEIFAGLFSRDKEQLRFAWMIIISMIPAAFVGIFFNDVIDELFTGNLLLVGICLLVTSALLYFAERSTAKLNVVSTRSALWMGIAQAIAILPGISRSGATIATGILCKADKSKAAEFSFLMVIPLILGKMLKDLLDRPENVSLETLPLVVGFVAAFISGIIACQFMLRLVRASKLWYFALYCIFAGVGCIIYYLI